MERLLFVNAAHCVRLNRHDVVPRVCRAHDSESGGRRAARATHMSCSLCFGRRYQRSAHVRWPHVTDRRIPGCPESDRGRNFVAAARARLVIFVDAGVPLRSLNGYVAVLSVGRNSSRDGIIAVDRERQRACRTRQEGCPAASPHTYVVHRASGICGAPRLSSTCERRAKRGAGIAGASHGDQPRRSSVSRRGTSPTIASVSPVEPAAKVIWAEPGARRGHGLEVVREPQPHAVHLVVEDDGGVVRGPVAAREGTHQLDEELPPQDILRCREPLVEPVLVHAVG